MAFFKQFPLIEYNNISIRNLMLKANIISDIFEKYDTYYPYVIQDWERPDTIAHDYYGDSKYWWVVLMSNNIIDPYYEWPLNEQNFKSFLQKKYGTTVDTLKSQIIHYRYIGIGGESEETILRKSWILPPETYDNLIPENKSGWQAVYTYDHEIEVNDDKRSIRLLDRDYIPQISKEIKKIFR